MNGVWLNFGFWLSLWRYAERYQDPEGLNANATYVPDFGVHHVKQVDFDE